MPPPIVPASGSGNRAPIARLTEKGAPRPSPPPAIRRPHRSRACAGAPREGGFGSRGPESGATRTPPRRLSPRRARRPPRRGRQRGRRRRGRQKTGEARPPGRSRTRRQASSRRRKSMIRSPTSNCSRRKWRACSAAKSKLTPTRRGDLKQRNTPSVRFRAWTALPGGQASRLCARRRKTGAAGANRHSSR